MTMHSKLLLLAAIAIAAVLSACNGGRDGSSGVKTIFDAPEINLVSAQAAGVGLAATMGALEAILPDPQGGPRTALPLCSGIQISRHHVLSAGHCAKYELVFNKFRLAASPAADALQFVDFGSMVRLTYTGDIDSKAAAVESAAPTFKTPEFISADLDFAVFAVPNDLGASGILDLRQATDMSPALLADHLAVLGYPNGVPLTTGDCHVLAPSYGPWLGHDCDALGGSSGGLIGDLDQNLPLALHLAGPMENNADFRKTHGIFESSEDIAAARGCPLLADGSKHDPECLKHKALNRALPLTTVRQTLERQAPELWARIVADLGAGASVAASGDGG